MTRAKGKQQTKAAAQAASPSTKPTTTPDPVGYAAVMKAIHTLQDAGLLDSEGQSGDNMSIFMTGKKATAAGK
jgi:hypothetical protein